jgi:hypothetical protein
MGMKVEWLLHRVLSDYSSAYRDSRATVTGWPVRSAQGFHDGNPGTETVL